MENKAKSILAGTLIAGSLLAAASSNANPFHYQALGSAIELRTQLLGTAYSNPSPELTCGAKGKSDSASTAKKGKDGKCGEGKCGGKKKTTTAKTQKKGR